MTKSILIETKNKYGNDLHYPACNESKAFCKLLGTKTLTRTHLTILINDLNYAVEGITNGHKYPFSI